jgi:hypothetical protein
VLLYCPRPKAPKPVVDVFWAVDINEPGLGPLRLGEKVTGPLPGQKTPPCEPRLEREVAGACWIPHLERPPCPPGYLEGAGMCLAPVRMAKRLPTTLGP